MRVGGTSGREVTMAAMRLCHRHAMSAVTRGATIVDKRQEVAREYATEKKQLWWLALADKNLQGRLMERRSGDRRHWQETAEMVEWQ